MELRSGADIMMYDTLLRYNLHLDPRSLCDEEWVYTLMALREIKRHEKKRGKKH